MSGKTPNLYQLQGTALHVTYSTTSVDGKPHFTYQDAHQSLSFKGDEIRAVSTEIGTIITVSLRRTVDQGSTSFSLLLPDVNLDASEVAHIATEGITTIHKSGIAPQALTGQKDLYTVKSLSGTARFAVF